MQYTGIISLIFLFVLNIQPMQEAKKKRSLDDLRVWQLHYDALRQAIKPNMGDVPDVSDIIEQISQEEKQESPALFAAIAARNYHLIKTLVTTGFSCNKKKGISDRTPLHEYCRVYSCRKTMSLMLNKGAFIDPRDIKGKTPLLCAANQWYNTDSIDFLLEQGADILAKTRNGKSLIDYPSGTRAHLDYLYQGAPIPRVKKAYNDCLASIDHLRDYFFPGFNNTPEFYTSYLNALLLSRNDKAAEIINRATVDELNYKNSDFYDASCLHWAVNRGNKTIVDILIDKNVDLNCRDIEGRTPLMWAARLGYLEIYQTLVAAGANRMIRDKQGRIALNYAANYRNLNVLKAMILENPNPFQLLHIENKKNTNALHCAKLTILALPHEVVQK